MCDNSNAPYDVLILGAGPAGIALARSLQQQSNIRYAVLEANNRIGGRVATADVHGWPIDLGASWLHHADASQPVYQQALAHSFPFSTETEEVNVVFDETGAAVDKATYDKAYELYCSICERLEAQGNTIVQALTPVTVETHQQAHERIVSMDTQPVTTALKQLCAELLADQPTPVRNIVKWLFIFHEQYEANNLCNLSLPYWDTCDRGVIDSDIFVTGGFATLLHVLSQPIRSHLLLERTVTHIDYSNNQFTTVTVTTPTGTSQQFTAKHVAITVPLGILKRNLIQVRSIPFICFACNC